MNQKKQNSALIIKHVAAKIQCSYLFSQVQVKKTNTDLDVFQEAAELLHCSSKSKQSRTQINWKTKSCSEKRSVVTFVSFYSLNESTSRSCCPRLGPEVPALMLHSGADRKKNRIKSNKQESCMSSFIGDLVFNTTCHHSNCMNCLSPVVLKL